MSNQHAYFNSSTKFTLIGSVKTVDTYFYNSCSNEIKVENSFD